MGGVGVFTHILAHVRTTERKVPRYSVLGVLQPWARNGGQVVGEMVSGSYGVVKNYVWQCLTLRAVYASEINTVEGGQVVGEMVRWEEVVVHMGW